MIQLLRQNVKPVNLKDCFDFLAARGNIPGDHEVIIALLKASVKEENLKNCFDFLIAGGNQDILLVVEIDKALPNTEQ